MIRRVLGAWLAVTVSAAAAAAQTAPPREIVQVRGDLYFARAGSHNTVFLVTPEGILLGDPISTEAATWLKGELDKRFPNRPVRHVVYSHHDFDHAEGAALFPGATIWAHANVLKNLDGTLHRLAGGYKDGNGNGRLERSEAGGGYLAAFDRLDRNKDGVVTAPEMNQEIVKPARTYTDRQTITFGGKTVQLLHPGRNHSDDMTVIYFPAERAAFGVDFISPGSAPGAWGDYDGTPLSEWIASIRAVEALDIDTFLPGHGNRGSRADVTANRQFLEDVAAAVQQGILEGRSLDDLKKSITLDAYAKWPNFAATGRPNNIEAAYNNLRRWPDQLRKELTVTVLGSVKNPNVFKVPPGTTVRQMLKLAGGLDPSANTADIRIMRIVGFDRREYNPGLDDQFLHNDTIIVPKK
jgi:glyoxylase-like metal-dependent hydrolase (beta-lactamase superfamily II)